jgi:hypothetical protein
MKKTLLSLAMVLSFLTGATSQDINRDQSTDSTIVAALGHVRSDSLLSYIQSLQDFGTRFMIAPNRKEVATWIMNKFISFGITEARLDSFPCYTYVNAPPYFVFDTTTWQYNVEAKITGSVYPSCEVVMMGHYDDCVTDSDPMVAAPGADDNASGVAALLESARVIMETGYQPGKTFIFLATAAEEFMLVSDCGSKHYAEDAATEGRDLSMVINNDMISWNDSLWTISLINDTTSQLITDLAIHVVETYTTLNWTYASLWTYADLSFFLDEGYKGIYYMENILNGYTPNYHTLYDLAVNIDTAYLTEITRLDLGCFLLSDLLENDAVLEDISRVPEENCTGLLSPMVTIANNGSDTLTSMDIVYRVNEESPVVVPWSGNLPFRENLQVELTGIPVVLLPQNELEITLENVNGKEDEMFMNNSRDISFDIADNTPDEIKLKIRLDDFPGETSWDIKSSNEEIIFSGGPYTTPNALVDETMVFDNAGCYTFTAYDAGGDGIQSGFILLYYGSNNAIISVLEFKSLVQTQFDVGSTLQTEEITQPGEIRFYPNPLHEAGYIAFTLDKSDPVGVVVFNLLRQKVMELTGKTYSTGSHIISFPAENLAPGLYIISARAGNQVVTSKMLKE